MVGLLVPSNRRSSIGRVRLPMAGLRHGYGTVRKQPYQLLVF